MNDFLNVLALVVCAISAVVATLGIMHERSNARAWRGMKEMLDQASRRGQGTALVKSKTWCEQSNEGPDPCDDQYPEVPLHDFSQGIALVISREGQI